MSAEFGTKIYGLSIDHRPTEEGETKRITENGGQIYQTQTMAKLPVGPNQVLKNHCILGPHRVFPGRLSVSRTFGDIEAKSINHGGNPKVVVSDPDILAFEVTSDLDFIVLGCDGIFDKMSNKECIRKVWESIKSVRSTNPH